MSCSELLDELGTRDAVRGGPWHLELDPEPRSAAAARKFVVGCLESLDEEMSKTVELLTSELVTNAILHARTPLVLGVAQGTEHILVCVEDRNLLHPEQQPYSEERTEGRGMVILQALAQQWGITTSEQGKAVWFTVRLVARGRGGTREQRT